VGAIETAGRNWFYIRIKHLYESERARLYRLNSSVEAIGFRLRRLSEVSPAAVNALAIVILAVLTNTRAVVTHTSPTTFLSFLYVFLRFAQGLGELARDGSGLIEYRPYLERLRALVGELPADPLAFPTPGSVWGAASGELTRDASPPRVKLERPAGLSSPAVAVRGLSFRYGEQGPWILRDLSVDVAPGAQLAIIGPSGCGKSTLLSIILGFLRPASGDVAIGGIAPERFCLQFAEYIGYVGPEPYIVNGTVRDNVLFGSHGEYGDEQIWRALSLASLRPEIEALPSQLDTTLRHHDVQLSMGQRQRLALARALVSEPVLLILDEASANLDDATEETIASSIRSLEGTTTLIVSHKAGLVRYVDQIIDLSTGSAGRARDPRSAT
jgi:ABC-type multidrug transport system fused ATPase/permease subunit